MADRFQVSCINKSNRQSPHERIQNIGGVVNGTRWKISEDEAIRRIEAGTAQYYVAAGGASVWVIVATHLGRKYLKTQNDGLQPDNLLSLPECR